jgi:hypothetical protein
MVPAEALVPARRSGAPGQEPDMNRPHPRNSQRQYAGGPRGQRQNDPLDLDRTASMADEGGCSGAKMDLRDQLADTRIVRRQPPMRPAATSLLLAGAGFAAGILAAVLWRSRTRMA